MATTTDAWDPAQYARFQAERSQPFFDLLALVRARPGMRVVDLGCGSGELTAEMHRRLGASETIGVDSSAAMIAQANAHAGDGLAFVHADLRDFVRDAAAAAGRGGAFDLVFSNAALQWVPEQVAVIEQLRGLLAPGGQVAIQVPANDDHVSHRVAEEVASEEPFRALLGGWLRRFPNLAPEGYAELLDRLGYPTQHVRLQVYVHHLPDAEHVVEWVRGALLTAYQRRLPPEAFEELVVRYRARLLARLGDRRPFLYPFKRILLWASAAAVP